MGVQANFFDTTAGVGAYQYEVTAVMH